MPVYGIIHASVRDEGRKLLVIDGLSVQYCPLNPTPRLHGRLSGITLTRFRSTSMRAIDGGRYGALEIGRPIQPPMLLWPKPLDLRLERGFDCPVRRLNGDHARPGIGDTASLADALDLRTLLREFASAQD